MPLPIDIKPYELKGVIGGDNYLTHYKAEKDEGDDYVITEFYPAYMVQRADDGTLDVSERFAKEFVADREAFISRAEGLKEVSDVSLHPVVEVFEKNHTAYLVRKACKLTTVDQYIGSQTMDFDEAYYFIRPLILSMAQAAEKGMYFNINPADFRVSAHKQLVLCATPAWDTNFHLSLIKIVRLYYRLVTGTEAAETGAATFTAYGITVPTRIESLVMEILEGDILYGSLDDFYKKFKSLIDGMAEADQSSDKRTLAAMRVLAAALFVVFAGSLVFLAAGIVNLREVGSYWAEPDIFADAQALPPPAHDFSDIMLTHPRNPADALSGSFLHHEGFLFFRGAAGMKRRLLGEMVFVPGAAGILAMADDTLIVPDVVPTSIVGHHRSIYFVDTASGNYMYRASVTGNDLTQITDFPVLNLAVIDDFIFYTNVEKNHSLYRLNLKTETHEPIYAHPVYSTLAVGSRLFFIADSNSTDTTALYAWDISEGTSVSRISNNATGEMRVFNDILYYTDAAGTINARTFDGRPISRHLQNVSSFDVFYSWIAYTEKGVNIPRVYHKDFGIFFTLSATEWVSYIRLDNENIYAIDQRDPSRIHNFTLPGLSQG